MFGGTFDSCPTSVGVMPIGSAGVAANAALSPTSGVLECRLSEGLSESGVWEFRLCDGLLGLLWDSDIGTVTEAGAGAGACRRGGG